MLKSLNEAITLYKLTYTYMPSSVRAFQFVYICTYIQKKHTRTYIHIHTASAADFEKVWCRPLPLLVLPSIITYHLLNAGLMIVHQFRTYTTLRDGAAPHFIVTLCLSLPGWLAIALCSTGVHTYIDVFMYACIC